MVKKNIRSYALLSVTVVLSLALLLGYLLYTDASLYNKHKGILSQRRGDVLVKDFNLEDQKIKVLLDNLSQIENTTSYVVYDGNFGLHTSTYTMESIESGETISFRFANMFAYFIPDYAWLDGFPQISSEVVWLDGEEHSEFFLDADEVILSEKVYFALHLDEENDPVFNLHSDLGVKLALRVVGYTKSEEVIDYADINGWSTTPPMILSTKLIDTLGLTGIILEMNTYGTDAYLRIGLFEPVELSCRLDDRTLSILKRSDSLLTDNGETVTLLYASQQKNPDGTTNVRLTIDTDKYTYGEALSGLRIMTGQVYQRTMVLPVDCVYQKTAGENEPWFVRQVTAEGIFLTEREIQIGYSNSDYVCVTGVEEGECFDMGYKAIVGG